MDLHKVEYLLLLQFILLLYSVDAKSIKSTRGMEPFELNEYLSGTFSTRSFNGTWLTDDSFLYRDANGDIALFNVVNKEATLFLARSLLADYPGASTTVSPDQRYVLIRYNVSAVFRHSTTAQFTILDIEESQYYDVAEKNHIQYAQWAPEGHGLAYVYLNNLFYLEEPSAAPRALTIDGEPGVLYNGVPDWVYEEEVLGTGSALWFSPNGRQLAFASFNDTLVEEFTYFIYGTPGDLEDQYPTSVKIRYPKVGTTNPTVLLFVADLDSTQGPRKINEFSAKALGPDDVILYDITWINDDDFAILSTNRVQNYAEVRRCSSEPVCADNPEVSYEETTGWLEPQIATYNQAGTQKIEILPQPEGDDKYDHLVLTNLEGNDVTRLTTGLFYVLSIYGWDEPNNLIYYLGTVANEPSQRQVYSINTESLESNCLTCSMDTSAGPCKYAAASFSTDFSYVTKVCQGPGPYLVEIQNTKNESDVLVWENNQALVDRLEVKALPVVRNLKVPIDGGRYEANVRLLLPPNLDESSNTKYPAVVNVYGGPNYNQINDAYSSGFQNYIVTNRQYIYIYIDGRGSGLDGQNKLFEIYRRLGTVEIEDQIAVTKWLQENLPYIDANNTGIWGWSYGGFATAHVLVQDVANVFKFGLSVAPVTSFIYYDSIYTERYMGLPTPEDNLGGYNNTDVTRNVEAFRGKLFFLVHGNGDDNVHYQQSMLLSKALEEADVPFSQQSYPDENHSLGGVYPHLYHTIDRFWARSFNLPDPPAPRLKSKDVKDE